jgi:hypothetical protein
LRKIPDVDSYIALRIAPRASAPAWWEAAGQRRDAPAPVTALLRGRSRVEVTADEAASALAWAGALAGWPAAEPKPLYVHEPDDA